MESRTIGADEVAEALGMSRAYAYKLIRRLNKEMEERGFKTKPEALAWERDFYAVQAGDMDMKLVDFLELYKKDMGPRLRLNTWKTKESIITKRILPYLGEKRMNQIAPVDVVRWQNELMALEKPSGRTPSSSACRGGEGAT